MTVRGTFDTTVLSNTPLCREHYRLTLGVDVFPPTSPGQFVQVLCADDDGQGAMLRRPFSLAARRDTAAGVEIDLIARTVGVGTRYLQSLTAGERVNILGPLGNGFTLPPAGGIALLVGGGVGIPPMLYLAEHLARAQLAKAMTQATSASAPTLRSITPSMTTPPIISPSSLAQSPSPERSTAPSPSPAFQSQPSAPPKAVVFCGAMTQDLIPLTITNDAPAPAHNSFAPLYNVDEFARHGIPAVLSTDDGTYGYKGFVTDTLRQYLDAYLTDNADRARTVIYCCGPEGMLKVVADVARRRNISCQVCVERAMACGLGTCQSCVIKVKKPDPAAPPLAGQDWCYRLACTDGPVFEATTLLW